MIFPQFPQNPSPAARMSMNRFKPQIDATAFNYPSVATPYRTRESPAADSRFSLVETCHESHGRDGEAAPVREDTRHEPVAHSRTFADTLADKFELASSTTCGMPIGRSFNIGHRRSAVNFRRLTYAKLDGRVTPPVVPWSCCRIDVKGPCYHDPLQLPNPEQNSTYESLNTRGCLAAMKTVLNGTLYSTAVLIAFLFVLQVSMVKNYNHVGTSNFVGRAIRGSRINSRDSGELKALVDERQTRIALDYQIRSELLIAPDAMIPRVIEAANA
ncbi:hypothetical protein K0M31_009154 [Melipona bicolor]|uniref:Uncharacterized protein n=1 Tax=Melipona bicolor TaxID=60889 RepID=A0AA40KJH8_9HYME|nr:hypothetical protein K0M31_009154 [Melipona bicolor]